MGLIWPPQLLCTRSYCSLQIDPLPIHMVKYVLMCASYILVVHIVAHLMYFLPIMAHLMYLVHIVAHLVYFLYKPLGIYIGYLIDTWCTSYTKLLGVGKNGFSSGRLAQVHNNNCCVDRHVILFVIKIK